MLTHLRPLVCVPFVFRRSRLVLSVARLLVCASASAQGREGCVLQTPGQIWRTGWEPLVRITTRIPSPISCESGFFCEGGKEIQQLRQEP